MRQPHLPCDYLCLIAAGTQMALSRWTGIMPHMQIKPRYSWPIRTAGNMDAAARGRAALVQLVHQRDRPQALAAAGAAAHAPAVRPLWARDGTELFLWPGVRHAAHASAPLALRPGWHRVYSMWANAKYLEACVMWLPAKQLSSQQRMMAACRLLQAEWSVCVALQTLSGTRIWKGP